MEHITNFSSEDFLKLKEIFFGELQQSQTTWLMPLPEPVIDICDESVERKEDWFYLDLGPVSALETLYKSIPVSNLIQQSLLVWVEELDQYISAQWENNSKEAFIEKGGGQTRLDLSFSSQVPVEMDFSNLLLITAEMESGQRKEFNLLVKGKTLVDFPYLEPDFNGSDLPKPHDFGMIDPVKENNQSQSYSLLMRNSGNRPLQVCLSEIPPWLTVDLNEGRVSGGKTGLTIEPGKQVVFGIQPRVSIDYLGENNAILILQTNDIRAALKTFQMPFSVKQEIKGAYVTLVESPQLELTPGGKHQFKIQLLNWGNQLARVSQSGKSNRIHLVEDAVIPMCLEQEPGKAELSLILDCEGLDPGDRRLELELGISGGGEDKLIVPVEIFVIKVETKPETVDLDIIDLEITLPAGKVCPRCSMISDMEMPYCSFCGKEIRDAHPIAKENVLCCQRCGRSYASSIEFCPEDGNPLVKIS